jgi:hypothetical protein
MKASSVQNLQVCAKGVECPLIVGLGCLHTARPHATPLPTATLLLLVCVLQVDTYLARVLAGLAQQPDVLEVEINSDAEWRPAGSTGPFISVLSDPAAAAQAAGLAGAAAAGGSGGGGSGSDDEDEAAELR